ncbi:MAG: YdbL family protein [Gallionella sp.]|nr:YdbL family protein [Gallionella sp.]MDD4946060.1 YdbL family protein [Gallionella sp.]MDD5613144.1 YdbL family protein [Gallionella sp.]
MRTAALSHLKKLFALFALLSVFNVFAAADLEVNTPGVNAIKASMQARHAQLVPFYNSGAVGIGMDGMVAICSAGAVPLAQRQTVNALVNAENADREALYSEIANANGHPEWHNEIRQTFAQRWIQYARPGWWILTERGWVQK